MGARKEIESKSPFVPCRTMVCEARLHVKRQQRRPGEDTVSGQCPDPRGHGRRKVSDPKVVCDNRGWFRGNPGVSLDPWMVGNEVDKSGIVG